MTNFFKYVLPFFLVYSTSGFSKVLYIPEQSVSKVNIANHLNIATDTSSAWKLDKLIHGQGIWSVPIKSNILNFGMTPYSYWIRLSIDNQSEQYYMRLGDPIIDEINFYLVNKDSIIQHTASGAILPFKERKIKIGKYLFKLPKGVYTCYIRLRSNFNLQVPIDIGTLTFFMEQQHREDIILSLYFGIMLVMLVYNLFVYFSVRDHTYLYYLGYIATVTLSYASFKGISFEFLWPKQPYLNFLIPSFASSITLFIGLFSISFLQTQIHLPKLSKGIFLFIFIFVLCIAINLSGDYQISAQISQVSTMIFSVYLIIVGTLSWLNGFRSARFFLLGWTLYLSSIVVYILKLNGILSHNNFTDNAVLYGSAMEAVLLSFALADRINIMRRETAAAQRRELQEREEKRKILEQQAETLRIEVEKATYELKQTQAKLVQTEKIASLTGMAAGLSHEINNPINISNTNLSILERDIEYLKRYIEQFEAIDLEVTDVRDKLKAVQSYGTDLKAEELFTEMAEALNKARRGLNRTVEVTQRLKDFSKVDRHGSVVTDINADLKTVIDIQQAALGEIQIETQFGEIPTTLCDAQRLMSCYQSILENAILAIKEKDMPMREGLIQIRTEKAEQNNIIIYFTDNGIGMDEATQQKIFDPFFTTRPVGNQGLGLCSVLGLVREHNGSIELESELGKGTTFKLTLPIEKSNQKDKPSES